MKTLSETVKAARQRAGWTQVELAKKSGLSQSTISDIERGRNESSRDLPAIASAFGITVESLLSGEVPTMQAALTVALQYGQRLNERYKNLKPNALEKLVNDYPSHGFVIDRKEARNLFERVRPATSEETNIAQFFDFQMNDGRLIIDVAGRARDFLTILTKTDENEGRANAEHTSTEGQGDHTDNQQGN